jgi:pimeloyl-ACP methyl ester carboxylesterase
VDPTLWLYILPGIYGAGRNWSSVARRLVRERADWGVVLVDLRQHGASQGFAGPHTLAAAAADVARLAGASGLPIGALLGHSFGGKVAMRITLDHDPPRQLWIVDSTPAAGEPGGSAWRMLEAVRGMPATFGSRDDFIDALERDGFDRRIGQWMATNLESRDDAYAWRFDLDAMEDLLRDFFRTDAWAAIEEPRGPVDIHFIKADESSVLSDDAVARVERAGRNGSVTLHRVDGGHWVNADNPDAMHTLLVENLPQG